MCDVACDGVGVVDSGVICWKGGIIIDGQIDIGESIDTFVAENSSNALDV